MDHAFPSHRTYVEDAKRGRQLTMDVLAIAAADDHERRCIIERRDPDIDATPVRDAVTRRRGGGYVATGEVRFDT